MQLRHRGSVNALEAIAEVGVADADNDVRNGLSSGIGTLSVFTVPDSCFRGTAADTVVVPVRGFAGKKEVTRVHRHQVRTVEEPSHSCWWFTKHMCAPHASWFAGRGERCA